MSKGGRQKDMISFNTSQKTLLMLHEIARAWVCLHIIYVFGTKIDDKGRTGRNGIRTVKCPGDIV